MQEEYQGNEKLFDNGHEMQDEDLQEDLLCDGEMTEADDMEHPEMQYITTTDKQDDDPTRRVIKPRKRRRGPDESPCLDNEIDYTATNYYHRYKNKSYVRRNDVGKYCQVCKAKRLGGKSRGLPSDLQLRKLWILRFNLEPERAAELWVKDAFSDNAHSGEVCSIHFPQVSESYRNSRDVLPIDMRDPQMVGENADDVDFGSMILTCVYCNAQRPLRSMIPFARARFRRRRWISALCDGDVQAEGHLREALKNGATKFLCDWHFADSCFSINTYGEWKLKKDALPNPVLEENERTSLRIYMINHVDSTIQRNDELRRRRLNFLMLRKHAKEKERMDRENSRAIYDRMRRTFPRLPQDQRPARHAEYAEPPPNYIVSNGRRLALVSGSHPPQYIEVDPEMPMLYPDEGVGPSEEYYQDPSTSQDGVKEDIDEVVEGDIPYSDDSDAEIEVIRKLQRTVDVAVSEARECVFCHAISAYDKRKVGSRIRTWPYDDVKHEKFLLFLAWPKEVEDEIRRLWVKRRIEPLNALSSTIYHYPSLSVCQRHLDEAGIARQYEAWLARYCVLCDEELPDENLLLPFPVDKPSRVAWAKSLFSKKPLSNLVLKQQQWLCERLTRETATHYRLCLFHFHKSSFTVLNECIDFDQTSQPLSLNICQYARIPRGPQGVVKCPLCDTWNVESEMTEIRTPNGQAERNFLVEMLISVEKATLRKGVDKLCAEASTICKAHMPDEDPYELIAERELVASITVQCVACSASDLAQNMTPFPHDPAKRIMWVDSMSRRRGNRLRLLNRLSLEGRHYICPAHFHPNALRYIPGLGIFKKFYFLPIPDPNEQPLTRVPEQHEDDYVPLLIDGIDNSKVDWHLSYDKVRELVGEVVDDIQEQFEEHPDEAPVVYTDREQEARQQEQEEENIVVDEVEYEPFEEADLNIERPGSPHIIADDIPAADREEVVVTDEIE
ncbi:unnamed protein product [Cylicocyclus nassatus]|uniref:THAP-type domain-containing protein n=1 Tax=Cylicocyclus nassatus TaxID=53992 RepID=A0AA36GHK0_CYLNA|nr:unnamed protein product [Cylicocyclus nassatus]